MGSNRRTGRALAVVAAIAWAACGLAPPDPSTEPPAPEQPQQPPQQPPDPGVQPPVPPAGYELVWEDDFEGRAVDASHWLIHSGRRRDAFDTPAAVTVGEGVLTITTSTERGRHETGFITSSALFLEGYFEARIHFSDSPGSWCAFWLLSESIGDPLGDPARAGVEIDVVEHRVTDQGGWTELADMVALTLNWDGYGEHKKTIQEVMPLPDGAPVQGAWHTYGVVWTAQGYTFYVDAVPLWSVPGPVSQVPESIQLTCEVDDESWAGDVPPGGYGTRAVSTTRMQVDWVRVWQPGP